jgi:hypothetical protein
MSNKCVNPFCNSPYRDHGLGKLFAVLFPPTTFEKHHNMPGRLQRFWLCEDCAQTMSVAVRREFNSVVVKIINLAPDGATKLAFNPPMLPSFAEPIMLRSA